MPPSRLSVIIPTLNEMETIESTLAALRPMQKRGAEVILVDGGSNDDTVAIAMRYADCVMTAPRGRALQMNAGANNASGNVLFFLHADSLPPAEADHLIIEALATNRGVWGRFDVKISDGNPVYSVIAGMMNFRSWLSGIATGDQGLFVTRAAFNAMGGFPELPLMEDISLSRSLKQFSRPICLRTKMITSSRRWQKHGILKTIVLMWQLRAAYFLGTDPSKLARHYRNHTE